MNRVQLGRSRSALSIAVLATASCLMLAPGAHAKQYRVMFQGSQALAQQSSGGPVQSFALPAQPAVAAPAPVVPAPPAVAGGCATGQCQKPLPKTVGAGVPNQLVTFRHAYTGQAITVPLTLPAGKPTVKVKKDRIVYSYGLFGPKVVVVFLECGKAEVRYKHH